MIERVAHSIPNNTLNAMHNDSNRDFMHSRRDFSVDTPPVC